MTVWIIMEHFPYIHWYSYILKEKNMEIVMEHHSTQPLIFIHSKAITMEMMAVLDLMPLPLWN